MFTSPSALYHSKEWKNLLNQIKTERLHDDGLLYCEHCGKPLIKGYDIIGHHKIEINNDNVNDWSISLNPDNIQLVHHSCHNDIHERFFNTRCRKVYLVYGPPLAGKSSYVNQVKEYGDLILDMDSIWQCISGCDRYKKPERIKSNVFQIRDTILEQIQYRKGKWNTAYIIGGYPFAGERERLITRLGCEEIFIATSQYECLTRLNHNPDGRDIDEWTKYINDWFKRYC